LTEYLTEQEQIEILKNWIKQYSLVIIAGVIIAMAGISGWRYWQQRQNKILTHASAVYNEMLTMRAQNNNQATLIQAKKLFTHYPQTTYAQMAALMLARNAEIMNDYSQAEKHLQWALDHSHIASFREVARLRLARLMLAQHKPQAALDLLDTVNDDHFIGLIHEVRGDAYLALHNVTLAKQSYRKALEELPNAEIVRPVLRMKYDNVNTTQTVS